MRRMAFDVQLWVTRPHISVWFGEQGTPVQFRDGPAAVCCARSTGRELIAFLIEVPLHDFV